jgi:hypothetical protein
MKAKTEKKINEVLDYFDFEKVQTYMIEVGWLWNINDRYVIPTKEQIKETAKLHLIRAYKEMKKHNSYSFGYSYSGGIYVLCYKTKKNIDFQLLFFITDYDTGI